MRKRSPAVLLVALALLGPVTVAQAGDLASLSAGLGWGSGVPDGLAWRLSASRLKETLFFGLRASGVEEFEILGPSPPESVRDYGLLVGVGSNDARTLRYVAVGVGIARGVWRTDQGTPGFFNSFERREETSIGLPFELGAMRHGQHFGIGVAAFGNLNRARSYLAFAVTVHLGRLD